MLYNYDNLPGINVSLMDGGLIIPDSTSSESILIIAPSLMPEAPEEPVMIRNSSELVENGFGDFYVHGEANPIAYEWKAAVDGGAKSIYCVALKEIDMERAADLEANAIETAVENGMEQDEAEAKFTGVLTGSTVPHQQRRSFIFLHDLLLNTLLDFSVDHVVLKGVTLEDQVADLDPGFFPEADVTNYPQIGGIITSSYVMESEILSYPIQITSGKNDKLVFEIDGEEVAVTLPEKKYDGKVSTIGDLVADLQEAISAEAVGNKVKVRENNAKIVFYFDEETSIKEGTTFELGLKGKAVWQKTSYGTIQKGSFAQVIADYCETKTLLRDACLGYIGVQSPVDTKLATIRKYVDSLMKLDTEMSPYLQVVASEVGLTMPYTNSTLFINGATHYAALVSTLNKESAPTNKKVGGVNTIRFDYSLRQLSKLTEKKLVTFRLKDGNLVVTDGCTTAPYIMVAGKKRDSDYARLSTLRITQLAITVVREAVEPFIGEPNQMPQFNALTTAIKSSLEKIREAGVINGYNFAITGVTTSLDGAYVRLEIVPAFEMRRVEVQVSLTASDEQLASLGL